MTKVHEYLATLFIAACAVLMIAGFVGIFRSIGACRDQVLHRGAPGRCSHADHELREEAETWTCRCRRPDPEKT